MKANGVALAAGVFGDPCTSLLGALSQAGVHVEISVEEKSAMAQALGASVAGKRALAVFKQVGVNVACDPLINAAIHGTGAGVLVLMGDDPGAAKSTNEQDSRWFAKLSELPVLTPHSADHLARSAVEGLELSETLGVPVLLQLTERLTQAQDAVGTYTVSTQGTFDRDRPWGRFILDRHRYLLETLYPKLQDHVEVSPLHRVQRGRGEQGVVSCGGVSAEVRSQNHFALGYAYPLPEQRLVKFLGGLKRVLVVEEVAPLVEGALQALVGAHGLEVQILGRLSGHLPRVGPLEARHVDGAFSRSPQGWNFELEIKPNEALMALPCGGFEPLYQALDELLPEEQRVAGDVGCSILQGYFPPQLVDTAYALGTSVATASGLSLNGHKGVALIGDTGFVHSGITGLLNAVEHGHNVLVVVLNNGIPGMTPGHVGIPGLAKINDLVRACGVDTLDTHDLNTAPDAALKALLAQRLQRAGVNVVVVKATPKPMGG